MQSQDFDASGGPFGLFEALVTRRKAPATVRKAVECELGRMPTAISGSGLAALSLTLADALDDPETRPTAKAMCARELREALDRLRVIAPPEEKKDDKDDLAAQRKKRIAARARRSAPKSSARP